jgi:hypothetical protein
VSRWEGSRPVRLPAGGAGSEKAMRQTLCEVSTIAVYQAKRMITSAHNRSQRAIPPMVGQASEVVS